MSLFENKELFNKLVKLAIYDKNFKLLGGLMKNGKITRYADDKYLLCNHNVSSRTVMWWKCELYPNFPHHEHKMSIKDKINTLGKGCDNCQKFIAVKGKLSGENDTQAYWDWEDNDTAPDKITKGSSVKCNFRCLFNHPFTISADHFAHGQRCNVCSGKVILKWFNSLYVGNSDLEYDWNWDINKVDPSKVARWSHTKYYFICTTHGNYELPASHYSRGVRCAKCAGKVGPQVRGRKLSNNLEASKWFDYIKNKVKLEDIPAYSISYFHFKCPAFGHEYETSAAEFTIGNRCPYCAGRRPLKGFNTLDTVDKAIIWFNQSKNQKQIFEYTKSCKQKVWFKCPRCNLDLYMTCQHFTKGTRCKKCNNTGYSRIAIEWLMSIEKKYNIDIRHAEKLDKEYVIPGTSYNADGYIELGNKKIIFEFHGDFWHGYKGLLRQDEINPRTKTTFGKLYEDTLRKETKLRELGYTLIVIWQSDYEIQRDKFINGEFEYPELS
ncbi:hypothetical protein D5b_00333 [Faustovirus]|nr:hypothetical protein D5b_00333 [Faustovirus]AMN84580.1 hypothetical protein D6_00174 [Faustovirus]